MDCVFVVENISVITNLLNTLLLTQFDATAVLTSCLSGLEMSYRPKSVLISKQLLDIYYMLSTLHVPIQSKSKNTVLNAGTFSKKVDQADVTCVT